MEHVTEKVIIYYWYDHLILRNNGDANIVMKAIGNHDFETFTSIVDKYQPNPYGLMFFPTTASVFQDDYLVGEINIMNPENFARIDSTDYECG